MGWWHQSLEKRGGLWDVLFWGGTWRHGEVEDPGERVGWALVERSCLGRGAHTGGHMQASGLRAFLAEAMQTRCGGGAEKGGQNRW